MLMSAEGNTVNNKSTILSYHAHGILPKSIKKGFWIVSAMSVKVFPRSYSVLHCPLLGRTQLSYTLSVGLNTWLDIEKIFRIGIYLFFLAYSCPSSMLTILKATFGVLESPSLSQYANNVNYMLFLLDSVKENHKRPVWNVTQLLNIHYTAKIGYWNLVFCSF